MGVDLEQSSVSLSYRGRRSTIDWGIVSRLNRPDSGMSNLTYNLLGNSSGGDKAYTDDTK